MFITSSGFKKLINEAYKKGGLHIANDGEGYTIDGGYWEIWVMYGWIPKKELAMIIELTGELPVKGEAFEASKDGNQYETVDKYRNTAMKRAWQCERLIEITPLVLRYKTGQQARILQNSNTKTIILVNDKFTDIISNSAVEFIRGENPAEGPFVSDVEEGIFYRSDTMAIHIFPRTDDENISLLRYLERFDIIKTGETDEYRLFGHGISETELEKKEKKA